MADRIDAEKNFLAVGCIARGSAHADERGIRLVDRRTERIASAVRLDVIEADIRATAEMPPDLAAETV